MATAATVFRDYETDGVPASGSHKVKKSDVRQLLGEYESTINAFLSNGGLVYTSKAAMDADLAHGANSSAWVIGDATVANNGIYRKIGASGVGSWSRVSDLPFSFIIASDVGAGTPNAIQATTSIPVSGSALIWMNVFEANTASPVTVSFNGGTALTIKTNSGNDVAVGGLTAGMIVMGIVSGSTFRLVSDQASAAIVAAAEAAQVAAEAAADRAEAAAASALATVATYGGSSSSDSAAAIAAMAAALGFVRFGYGSTLVGSSLTVDVPVEFMAGAYVTVAATRTLTIRDVVTSPKQWIFRGDGLVSLAHDATLGGENARYAHASWFGAFPQAGVTADQAPSVQKAYTAMGNTREGVIELDIGNYPFLTGVTTTRGIHLKGQGTRRTVIRCDADGFDAITTGNVAGKISDLQFEVHSSMTTRANAFIRSLHDDFEIYNVNAGQSALGIVVAGGNNCRIRNIKAAYGAAQGAGSSLIKITAGATHSVKGIYISSSGSFGPDWLVDVDAAAASVSNVEIEDIQTINPSVPVRLRASAANMSTISVRNITFAGFAGAIPATVVHILAESTFGISGVNVNGIVSNSRPNSAVRIESTSTAVTENIVIDNVILPGATGNGIEFIRSAAGALRDIIIGSAVEVSERATPFFYSGSPTGIRISPTALKDALPAVCYDFSITDDSVASISLQRSVFAGWLMVAIGNTERAIYTFRAASAPTVTAFGTPSANMNAANTALTGTTGADTKFTTGVTDGVLYFENRLGGTQRVTVTLMTGA